MARDLLPADMEHAAEEGRTSPFYLFHGPNEFLIEKLLDRVKEVLVPEATRALNLEIFYGGESRPSEIMTRARSIPFLAARRLIIVRRVDGYKADALDEFMPYLQGPVETTCLIFICHKADFKKEFFKAIRSAGRAVHFEDLRENQVPLWIKQTAAQLGFKMDTPSCLYLQQVAGNDPRDLYGELEKIRVRFGGGSVGLQQVEDTVAHHRSFTIFELMALISQKKCAESLVALNRFLEEEDRKDGPGRFIGMLNRQIRLLFQTKATLEKGGRKREVEEILGSARFSANEFMSQARRWSSEELRKGLALLYEADGQLKTGFSVRMVLENVVLRLCRQGDLR